MDDSNDGKKIIAGLVGTGLFIWLVNKYGMLNVLFWGALALVVLMGSGLYLANCVMNSGYDITWAKVKTGDSLYYQHEARDTISDGVHPQLLVRPINKSDIEALQIEEGEKNKMISRLATDLRPKLIDAKFEFAVDSMYRYGTAFIGTFVKKDTSKNLGLGPMDAFGDYWYAIKPDTTHARCCYISNIPKGYILADKENYYVPAGQIRLQEQKAFLLKKKQPDTLKATPSANATPPAPQKKHHKKHKVSA